MTPPSRYFCPAFPFHDSGRRTPQLLIRGPEDGRAFLEADYTKRAEPRDIIAALDALE
ncbi:MAG: hypothetical protein P1U81_01970 [Verrucomicrobiales bacterium]|nr:hypothetical protein [Verrucomicrobiales bacterium]